MEYISVCKNNIFIIVHFYASVFCFFCRLRTRKPRIPACILTADCSSISPDCLGDFDLAACSAFSLEALFRRAVRLGVEFSFAELFCEMKNNISTFYDNRY